MFSIITTAWLALGLVAAPQQDPMQARGADAMGFDQDKAAHHFLLYEDGGAIDISVKVPEDDATRSEIRSHLPHIAMMFGAGNFEMPHFIHATNVPGTDALARLAEHLTYRYRETEGGGRVDITTSNTEAIAALHAFLRFQISDHKTGDTGLVTKRGS